MKCVILQPSYIPWRGYFHQIHKADVFVFYDDVQYDKHGWRNRNRLKGPNGPFWVTIPVITKGVLTQNILIKDVRVEPRDHWRRKHCASIRQAYRKAPFFQEYEYTITQLYSRPQDLLADFTIDVTIRLAGELGITNTQFVRSSELRSQGTRTDRLIDIVKEVGGTHYLSGPSARDYLEEVKFHKAGVTLEYMSYEYPEYQQLYPPFDPQVSVVDLLFMTGPEAGNYIWDV